MSFGKKDILKNISSKAQIPYAVSNKLLEVFLDIVRYDSRKKIIKLSNFGSFYTRNTPQRVGRNPKTKEEFIIRKRSKLFFKPSNKIKSLIN